MGVFARKTVEAMYLAHFRRGIHLGALLPRLGEFVGGRSAFRAAIRGGEFL